MAVHTVDAVESTVQKTHIWLKELIKLGRYESEAQAYTALQAVLWSLRDRLTVEEAAQLSAQMPVLIRGVYYENWKPATTPHKERTLQEFVESVRKNFGNAGNIDPFHATRSVFRLLDEKISTGQLDDVKHMLPSEVRDIWP